MESPVKVRTVRYVCGFIAKLLMEYVSASMNEVLEKRGRGYSLRPCYKLSREQPELLDAKVIN
jgi:hypothetical protein